MKSQYEVIDDFKSAMRENGVEPPEPPEKQIIADGEWHRYRIRGHKSGTKNGAYRLHLDGRPAGYFKDHKSGIEGKWKSDAESKPLSDAERQKRAKEAAAWKAEKIKKDEQRLEAQAKAADSALWIWAHSKEITDRNQHAYLTARKINANGARLYRGRLIYRLFDVNKKVVSIRFIKEDSMESSGFRKRPLPGALKIGAFGIIGKPQPDDTLLIAEGFSTSSALHEAYGHPVFIAVDKGEMTRTALAVRTLYPYSKIVVCGDNDADGGGQKAAIAAATAIKGYYILPPTAGQDFNDILTAEVNPDDC
jgi:putative DNA primase/helicase